jgi:hypothetical protein
MTIEDENSFRSAVRDLCQNYNPKELPAIMDQILEDRRGLYIEMGSEIKGQSVLADWIALGRNREAKFRLIILALVKQGYNSETLHKLLNKAIEGRASPKP